MEIAIIKYSSAMSQERLERLRSNIRDLADHQFRHFTLLHFPSDKLEGNGIEIEFFNLSKEDQESVGDIQAILNKEELIEGEFIQKSKEFYEKLNENKIVPVSKDIPTLRPLMGKKIKDGAGLVYRIMDKYLDSIASGTRDYSPVESYILMSLNGPNKGKLCSIYCRNVVNYEILSI